MAIFLKNEQRSRLLQHDILIGMYNTVENQSSLVNWLIPLFSDLVADKHANYVFLAIVKNFNVLALSPIVTEILEKTVVYEYFNNQTVIRIIQVLLHQFENIKNFVYNNLEYMCVNRYSKYVIIYMIMNDILDSCIYDKILSIVFYKLCINKHSLEVIKTIVDYKQQSIDSILLYLDDMLTINPDLYCHLMFSREFIDLMKCIYECVNYNNQHLFLKCFVKED